jgi:hypothetical protein
MAEIAARPRSPRADPICLIAYLIPAGLDAKEAEAARFPR